MSGVDRFDPHALLETLQRHGVRFVVIGGIAGRLHGSPRMTRDLDICYARDIEDLDRLAMVLAELHVTLRGAPPDLPFRPDARTLRSGLNFTFDTPFGPFDCLGEASGHTYEILRPNAERAVFEGLDILVTSLDDLMRMKRASGRPQDLADLETLGKLRDVREERGLFGLAEPGSGRKPPAKVTRIPRRSPPKRPAKRT